MSLAQANALFALKKLAATYSGAAVRVRRDSDNAEQDIGFNSGGMLDESALASFLGGASGFVKIWYDQSGLANDLVQATGSIQPAIATTGQPHIVLDGIDDKLTTAGNVVQGAHAVVATYDEAANFTNFPGLFCPGDGPLASGIAGGNSSKNLLSTHTGAQTWVAGLKGLAVADPSAQNIYTAVNANQPTALLQVGQERTTAGRFWGGKVYAAASFAPKLANGDRIIVENELAASFGLPMLDVKSLYLFAGQSNMLGADALIAGTGSQNLVDAGLQQSADAAALFSFDKDAAGTDIYGVGDIRGHETAAASGVYVHGPEVGFVRQLALLGTDPATVAIIKFCANFAALASGRSPWLEAESLGTAWRAAVDQRIAEMEALGNRWAIGGYCWHQGIDDAIQSQTQNQYTTDLIQIIAEIRATYGSARFVLARSVNSAIATPAKMAPIRAGQETVAISVDNTGLVDTDDLTPYVNTHHLSAANQLIAGQRYATSMISGNRDLDVTLDIARDKWIEKFHPEASTANEAAERVTGVRSEDWAAKLMGQ